MKRSLQQRWRERGGRMVHIVLPFDDIMEFALALLALTPVELEALDWTFADRKRLLDHFLASGKNVQGRKAEDIAKIPIELALPQRDVDRLQHFARRELPKAASNPGVIDFLEKPYHPENLLEAIDKACSSSLRSIETQLAANKAREKVAALSNRQREVLRGILNGKQSKVIAYELNLSTRTVEAYRAQLLARLGVRSTADAVRMGLDAGLDDG